MPTTTKTRAGAMAVAGLVAVVAGWVAWREHALNRKAERALDEIARDQTASAGQMAAWQARLDTAKRGAEAARHALEELAAAEKARAGGAEPAGGEAASKPAAGSTTDPWLRMLRTDPKLQALELAAKRPRLRANFGPLFRELGLTTEKAERFIANVMCREEGESDLQAAIEANGISEEDDAVMRLRGRAIEEYEAAQRDLLGSEGFERAKAYEHNAPARDAARGLAAVAVAAGVPLTAAQAEQVARVVIGAVRSERPESQVWTYSATIDWAQVEAQARTVLSDAQYALLLHTEPPTHGWFDGRLERAIDQARAADAKAAKAAQAQPGR